MTQEPDLRDIIMGLVLVLGLLLLVGFVAHAFRS